MRCILRLLFHYDPHLKKHGKRLYGIRDGSKEFIAENQKSLRALSGGYVDEKPREL